MSNDNDEQPGASVGKFAWRVLERGYVPHWAAINAAVPQDPKRPYGVTRCGRSGQFRMGVIQAFAPLPLGYCRHCAQLAAFEETA